MRISDGVQTCALPIFRLDTSEAVTFALERAAEVFDLRELDAAADERLCEAFHAFQAKADRRQLLHAYLGFPFRSEEHTSELQSLMRISYAVFCLKKKKHKIQTKTMLQYEITIIYKRQ